jgi:NAD(P)-dependent dehydrogenase (short-subunit alcohol dehydrogenase family)
MTEQRIVLVTGASRGIGAVTARLAGTEGYDVAVNFARNAAGAATVVADIERPAAAPSPSRPTSVGRTTSSACSPPSTRSSDA